MGDVIKESLLRVLSGLENEKAKLQHGLDEIDSKLKAVKLTAELLGYVNEDSGQVVDTGSVPPKSSQRRLEGTIREALEQIAKEKGGTIKVGDARRILLDAGKVKNNRNTWGMIYTVFSRSGAFEKAGPGKFRLVGSNGNSV